MKYVLSIAGGGIRGLIPAMILEEIERQTGRPIAKCFDLIAGTSTGGIIAALLTTPNSSNEPKYSAEEIVWLYKQFGEQVFQRSLLRKIVTVDGLLSTKYKVKPLENLLKSYFGKTRLSQTITDVLIPAYQISDKPYPYFFKTENAKKENSILENPYLWECARATSAANSYFAPYRFDQSRTFLDGGLFANTPALCAYAQVKNTYGEQEEVMILSIGTGEDLIGYCYQDIRHWGMLQWAIPFFKQNSISAGETVDYMLRTFTKNIDPYYRIQTSLNEDTLRMDDASKENMERLELAARQTIMDNSKQIMEIASLLQKEENN